MELNCEHFRAIIFYNFRRGLTQQQCIDELNSIFGDETPSSTCVYRWYSELNRGRSSLQDEFREGRPKSVVVLETIDAVRQLIHTYLHSYMHTYTHNWPLQPLSQDYGLAAHTTYVKYVNFIHS